MFLGVLALLAMASPVSALPKANVSMFYCVGLGDGITGAQNVPAGTKLGILEHWGAKTPAQIRQFRRYATITASVDGVPVSNPNSYWGAAYYSANNEQWQTTWTYVGPRVVRDRAIVVKTHLTFSRPIDDGYDHWPKGPLEQITCTLTGV
jgi:hypothetical protein